MMRAGLAETWAGKTWAGETWPGKTCRATAFVCAALFACGPDGQAAAQQPAAVVPMSPEPARASAPGPAAETAPPVQAHALAGLWLLSWVGEGKATRLEVSAVARKPNVTGISGTLVALSGAACPLSGEVIDEMKAFFADGIVLTRFTLQTFVTFKAECPGQRLRFDLLGFSEGRVLLSGRAVAETGDKLLAVVALTRQNP